jgi:hypothetical protein
MNMFGPCRWSVMAAHTAANHFSTCTYAFATTAIYGNLVNLHLVAMSMFERHMVLNVFNMISKFMDAL